MGKFPQKIFKNTSVFAEKYFEEISKVSQTLDFKQINNICKLLEQLYKNKKNIFICGNGGSASISNHFLCDHQKGSSTNTKLSPKIISLSSNIEIITAISNDISFNEIFSFQLSKLANSGDCLITISSSGNSKNIILAIEWAKKNKLKTISLNGFDGGKANKISDLSVNVPSNNYGVVEDIHSSIMHILSQSLRMKNLLDKKIEKVYF